MTAEGMAKVLYKHRPEFGEGLRLRFPTRCRDCDVAVPGWAAWDAHVADALAAAGYGSLAEERVRGEAIARGMVAQARREAWDEGFGAGEKDEIGIDRDGRRDDRDQGNPYRKADPACHHCGRYADKDGDHTCPCPLSDSECLEHTLNPVPPERVEAKTADMLTDLKALADEWATPGEFRGADNNATRRDCSAELRALLRERS